MAQPANQPSHHSNVRSVSIAAFRLRKNDDCEHKLDGRSRQCAEMCWRTPEAEDKAGRAKNRTDAPVDAQPIQRLKRQVASADHQQHGWEKLLQAPQRGHPRSQFGFDCPPADFDEALLDASHSGWIIDAEPGNVRLA